VKNGGSWEQGNFATVRGEGEFRKGEEDNVIEWESELAATVLHEPGAHSHSAFYVLEQMGGIKLGGELVKRGRKAALWHCK
jgi:hypothetical protein